METINVCSITNNLSTLSYYSHLIPLFFSLFLALLIFFKAPRNLLSRIFIAFSITFSFWLIADLVTWVSNNYFLIYSFWSPVDYIESAMYILGLYFVMVFAQKKDLSKILKYLLFIATLIPLVITVTKNSVLGFDHAWCEAFNNNLLLNYRFYIQILTIAVIFIYVLVFIFKKEVENRKTLLTVLISMFLFLATFGITSYISASTSLYKINLYALLIIPAFLISITYSIFSLNIFNTKIVSTYFLVFGLIILNISQLMFITNVTNKLLTVLTIILSLALSFIIFKNLKKETDLRKHIETLSVQLEKSKMRLEESNFNRELANDKLKELDKLKTEFLSLASHQLRSPLTAIKGYSSMVLDGDYGKMDDKVKDTVEKIYKSSDNLSRVVEDLLNVSKIEQGGMKYDMVAFDINLLAEEVVDQIAINAKGKKLDLSFTSLDKESHIVIGDKEKIRQVILNLIDNSIKYTKSGYIKVSAEKTDNKIILKIKDSGAGIKEENKKAIFEKFERGDGGKIDSSGSGLGLYLAKEIMEAHNGYIWAESEGVNKGSTFIIELKAVN